MRMAPFRAVPITTFAHSGFTVTTSSIEIASADPTRMYLRVTNTGTAPVFLRFDGVAATADLDALRLIPGESTQPLNYIPGTAVFAIADSGSQDLHIVTGGAPIEVEFFQVVDGLGNDIVDSSGNRIVA